MNPCFIFSVRAWSDVLTLIHNDICFFQVVASQDWPEVTKYAGLVCAQAHRQELIQDLFKEWKDPQKGVVTGGMIKYSQYC